MNKPSRQFVQASIGQKVLMSLTGLFLCVFLVVHVVGNLQLFRNDGGAAFNEYSYFMTTFTPIKIVSYLLYLTIILHAVQALILTTKNNKARKVKYAMNKAEKNSVWASRNMGILGTILLIFIVIHMKTFWFEYKFGSIPTRNLGNGDFKDLYTVVVAAFSELWYVALYVVCMIALGFHMQHGFQSAFQSLGLNHSRVNLVVKHVGIWIFAILIPALFAAMPIFFYYHSIKH